MCLFDAKLKFEPFFCIALPLYYHNSDRIMSNFNETNSTWISSKNINNLLAQINFINEYFVLHDSYLFSVMLKSFFYPTIESIQFWTSIELK